MNLQTNQKGFTIVELLIVIVVIAILAAISIVAYTGVQENARNTQRVANAKSVIDAATTAPSDTNKDGLRYVQRFASGTTPPAIGATVTYFGKPISGGSDTAAVQNVDLP
ncbi:hypothetical protein B7Y92_02275 [Candidatus Saccharibacteria bacterium 32-50-13]|nr:MAG: hypothetical protein B7Y92_02275 [Candidatus Saccharibacteria bacterium 32-50-13]